MSSCPCEGGDSRRHQPVVRSPEAMALMESWMNGVVNGDFAH